MNLFHQKSSFSRVSFIAMLVWSLLLSICAGSSSPSLAWSSSQLSAAESVNTTISFDSLFNLILLADLDSSLSFDALSSLQDDNSVSLLTPPNKNPFDTPARISFVTFEFNVSLFDETDRYLSTPLTQESIASDLKTIVDQRSKSGLYLQESSNKEPISDEEWETLTTSYPELSSISRESYDAVLQDLLFLLDVSQRSELSSPLVILLRSPLSLATEEEQSLVLPFFKLGFTKVADNFKSLYGESAVIEKFIISGVPNAQSLVDFDAITLQKRAKVSSRYPCWTKTECETNTRNCSAHGSCVPLNKTSPPTSTEKCYFCSCTSKSWTDDSGQPLPKYKGPVTWTGDACQFLDISTTFHIVFWFSVAGFVTVLLCVSLLASIDSERTGAKSVGTRPKTD